jgi:hypothetical protein
MFIHPQRITYLCSCKEGHQAVTLQAWMMKPVIREWTSFKWGHSIITLSVPVIFSFSPIFPSLPQDHTGRNIVVNESTIIPGYDLYVLGAMKDSVKTTYGFWKNGKWKGVITDATILNDFSVEKNGDTYLVGSRMLNRNGKFYLQACCWKDSMPVEMETDPGRSSDAVSIARDDENTVIAGNLYDQKVDVNGKTCITNFEGIIWENGKVLYRFPEFRVIKVKVINKDIFAAGYYTGNSNSYTIIFKNGKRWLKDNTPGTRSLQVDMDGTCTAIAGEKSLHIYQYRTLMENWSLFQGYHFTSTALCLTSRHKVVLGGCLELYDNRPSQARSLAAIWRNNHFQTIENHYESVVSDMKEVNGKEILIGEVFRDRKAEPDNATACIWFSGKRADLSANDGFAYAHKVEIVKR